MVATEKVFIYLLDGDGDCDIFIGTVEADATVIIVAILQVIQLEQLIIFVLVVASCGRLTVAAVQTGLTRPLPARLDRLWHVLTACDEKAALMLSRDSS